MAGVCSVLPPFRSAPAPRVPSGIARGRRRGAGRAVPLPRGGAIAAGAAPGEGKSENNNRNYE